MDTEIDDNIARWNANFNPADWDPNDPAERVQIVNILLDEDWAAGYEYALRLHRQKRADRHQRLGDELYAEEEENEEDWGPMDPHGLVDGWQLEGELGFGASGRVFKASSEQGRPVVLKWVAPIRPNAMWESRAASEVAVLKQLLGDPHIIQYIAAGRHAGRSYLVMERAMGDLDSLPTPVQPMRAVVLAAQVFRGLASAHALGIVHRDIKPSNILLSHDWLVKIGDWGIVRLSREMAELTLTIPGEVLGTVAYMAPEFFTDDGEVGPAADVFAMCCVLAQLVSGMTPKLSSDGQIRIPRVMGRLGDIIASGTVADPRRRPTAMEMALALEDLMIRGS